MGVDDENKQIACGLVDTIGIQISHLSSYYVLTFSIYQGVIHLQRPWNTKQNTGLIPEKI